jgi:hypothetical protein
LFPDFFDNLPFFGIQDFVRVSYSHMTYYFLKQIRFKSISFINFFLIIFNLKERKVKTTFYMVYIMPFKYIDGKIKSVKIYKSGKFYITSLEIQIWSMN